MIDHSAALASDDDNLRQFAATLEERFVFVDLRTPEIGMGFSWGRFEPQTQVRRHGYQRLFAHAPPQKKQRLLSRLFADQLTGPVGESRLTRDLN